MGAACAQGGHDSKVAAEIVAEAKQDYEYDGKGGEGIATEAAYFDKEVSLATASTQSDGGSSTTSLRPVSATSTELDLFRATDTRPLPAAAAEWRSPNNDALRWADGASYTGDIRNGKMSGYGKWTSADASTSYAGEWLDDMWHGKGQLVSEVGTYNGEFQSGAFDGNGIMRWFNHAYYEGAWKQGKRDGYGLNVSKMGQQRAGYWKQNRFVGFQEEKGCWAWGSR